MAGAADTGILATVVAAAESQPGNQAHYTVLDRCETPLKLCQEYGQRLGIDIATVKDDLTKVCFDQEFDVIVLHSVFSFLSGELRKNVIKAMSRWLRLGGYLVFCSKFGQKKLSQEGLEKRTAFRIENLEAAVGRGEFSYPDNPQAFNERVIRNSVMGGNRLESGFRTEADIYNFQASLRPREIFWDIQVPKIDSAFDNLLVSRTSWSPTATR